MGCLILLRIEDGLPENHPKHHSFFQRWDVVTVVPDWWQPGSLDMADGGLLFVECPDMEADEAGLRLCGKEPGNPKDNPNLRMRMVSIKPELMPPEKAAAIDKVEPIPVKDGQKDKTYDEIYSEAKAMGFFVSMTKAEILAARETKAPIPNPFIIGDDPFRIG